MSNEVDDWFAERQHPLTDAMQRTRKLILEADPRVTESIKWKTPTFSYRPGSAPMEVVTNDIDFSHDPVVRDHFP